MRNSKAECLEMLAVVKTLSNEYEARLSELRERERELEAELKAYATTDKLIALREPEIEQKKETILTGKV